MSRVGAVPRHEGPSQRSPLRAARALIPYSDRDMQLEYSWLYSVTELLSVSKIKLEEMDLRGRVD